MKNKKTEHLTPALSPSDAEREKNPVGRPPTSGQAAEGHVHLRVTMARKSAWVKAARPGTLAEWMTKHLDRAAENGR